ncbi:MAG: HEPN domain-containing protein [candidate division NC10 bacterium]|nr:HEPN domain-containing protein [candidate division NC10 bacterium]
MMTQNVAALVRFRIEEAEAALGAARILLREGSLRASVNRSYYAMFYAVLALLASRKEESSKHGGVISLFDRRYIHTHVFPQDFSKWLRRAFDLRTRCDYGRQEPSPGRRRRANLSMPRVSWRKSAKNACASSVRNRITPSVDARSFISSNNGNAFAIPRFTPGKLLAGGRSVLYTKPLAGIGRPAGHGGRRPPP